MIENKCKEPILKEEEVFNLIRKLLSNWRQIGKIVGLFFIMGIIVALSTIKEYTAQVVMAPESTGNSPLGNFSSLAAIAGIDVGSLGAGSGDALYPLLYPDIVSSLPFLTSLMDVEVQTLNGSVDSTYYYYRKFIQKNSWILKTIESPKKVSKWLFSKFNKEETWSGDPSVFNAYYLSEGQITFIDNFSKHIDILIDKKTEVITISFTSQDPKVSAIMAEEIKVRLQKAITDYKTNKAISDYTYIENLYNESKKEYESAQYVYADFCDKNRAISAERLLIEKDRLEADRDMKNLLFTQWAQQLQYSKAKIQEKTPAFTVLKPAVIPPLPSTPRKLKTITLYIFLGLVLGSAYILSIDSIKRVYIKIVKREL